MAHAEHAGPPMRPLHHHAAPQLSGNRVPMEAISDIADELGKPYAEVSAVYWDLYVALEAKASVTHFLPVLVFRKVREHGRKTVL